MDETKVGLGDLAQAYDTAMRLWADVCLAEMAVWLDPSLAGLPRASFVKRAASFVVPLVTADLLMSAGPGQLLHVEYESAPAADLVQRMYDYRGRIMKEFPGQRLTQYILVLGLGTVKGFDDQEKFGFALDVRVRYLRDHDPAEFLSDPVLAPFAVLARGSRQEREASLGAAVRLISRSGHPQRLVLLQVALALARIHLDSVTIDRIEMDNGINIQPLVNLFRDHEFGRQLLAEGREEGREEGRVEARQAAREGVLLAVLRSRFADGPHLPAAAQRLAQWDDEAAAVRAITTASSPDSLLSVEPSTVD